MGQDLLITELLNIVIIYNKSANISLVPFECTKQLFITHKHSKLSYIFRTNPSLPERGPE